MKSQFDVIVIGGGIFGSYAAIWLAKQGKRVALIEKEKELFTKASIVNQARLHGGYHYPRSIATAMMSDENKARFTSEHHDFINFSFEKYYAVDRFASFTDAKQFERFCDYINIKCERVERHPYFNYDRLEALYLTQEYSFDPILIANYYKTQLADYQNISILKLHKIKSALRQNKHWVLAVENLQNQTHFYAESPIVINATYSASNALNQIFGVDSIHLMHEISEMVFVNSPQFANMGLTVMDGPFASLMPYGLTGLLSLSSVAYTHHKVSYDDLPTFDCQQQHATCRPDFTSICNGCVAQPVSAKEKMLAQIQQYLSEKVELQYFSNFFTIKSKLKANAIDDGRPTEIAVLHEDPYYYNLFAGKINSIYEIEKVINPALL
jgi:FAD dependent oxidoreductase